MLRGPSRTLSRPTPQNSGVSAKIGIVFAELRCTGKTERKRHAARARRSHDTHHGTSPTPIGEDCHTAPALAELLRGAKPWKAGCVKFLKTCRGEKKKKKKKKKKPRVETPPPKKNTTTHHKQRIITTK
eukprot:NODE_6937_length_1624_cov_2.563794.p2 GENE.NODE_6937_length_1624_cov_2.563794~~NODE_6937_length_1624_cov_2.563794.p2  ORF type:complete len:129 (+),score=27.52 NODE_6937_length_1624_cov_2.563794:1232-1618(+)